jgi:hypothetical protein
MRFSNQAEMAESIARGSVKPLRVSKGEANAVSTNRFLPWKERSYSPTTEVNPIEESSKQRGMVVFC